MKISDYYFNLQRYENFHFIKGNQRNTLIIICFPKDSFLHLCLINVAFTR